MRDTIKKHSDFQTAEDAPLAVTHWFLAKSRPTKFPGDARYGLITTKRIMKHATDRNRARRLLRAWIRICEDDMKPEYDYIFIARLAILQAKRDAGIKQMRKALKKINQ